MTIQDLLSLESEELRYFDSPIIKDITARRGMGEFLSWEDPVETLSNRHALYYRTVLMDYRWGNGGWSTIVHDAQPERVSSYLSALEDASVFFGAKRAHQIIRAARPVVMEAANEPDDHLYEVGTDEDGDAHEEPL